MKKIYKVLIAFLVIGALAIGAYFLLNSTNKNQDLYKNMQNYNANITYQDKNVINEVNSAIQNMIVIIQENNLEMENEKAFLQTITQELNFYALIQQNALTFGKYINEVDNSEIVSEYNKNYSKIVELYNKGYNYLRDTYFKIYNTSYSHIETMASYIKNFVIVIKDADVFLNDFFYNAGLLTAFGTKNISDFNNLQKLQISTLSYLNNMYFTADEETDVANIQLNIDNILDKITNTNLNKYIDNKGKIDTIINNVKSLNLYSFIISVVNGSTQTFIDGVQDNSVKQILTDFATLVLEV